jgi:multiple sugar transport system ATP-binding protein
MSTLELRGVGKSFGAMKVIHEVDVRVEDREFVVIVGPSGCGKSTLLRMIAGLEEVNSGELLIDGKRMNDVPAAKRQIAMVFQSYALYPNMTARENLAFSLKLAKVPRAEIAEKVARAAAILKIEELLDRRPGQMSGGQRQRVAIGRAIVRNPKIFLFDEPLSNLDAKLRVQMRVELKKLHERLGTTAIYVTHDQVEAMTLGDRVVVMRDGRVQQVGDPMELYNQPANRFVAGFIGSPAMNFAEVRIAAGAGAVWAESDGIRIKVPPALSDRVGPYAGKAVTMGVRPEDMHIAGDGESSDLAIEAAVEVVERLGAEILLDVAIGGATMVASVEPTAKAKVHERLRLALNPDRLHFFDSRTEAAI